MTACHIAVKICGLGRTADIEAAVSAGADYLGFVFYPPSPRHLPLAQAETLAAAAVSAKKVALTVDADDSDISRIIDALGPDLLQLHGSETPQRAGEIRSKFGVPVMKALGVRSRRDLQAVPEYSGWVDQLLIDAKPAAGATRPGGNGLAFDWRVLDGWMPAEPWMLAGGLNADNVTAALELTGARQVDVSSGVETAPGNKSRERITKFLIAVRRSQNAQ